MHTRSRTDINNMISRTNGVFVVFHHDYGITEVAQMHQGIEQAFIIALVQTDGRFVQHIHHAHQARTDLAGQANPLRFTARQGFRRTGEGEITQPDIHQEL